MKRLLLFVSILALLLLPIGCGVIDGIITSRFNTLIQDATGNFTIKVGGTVGLNFTGEYEAWFLHYVPDTQSFVYTKESYTVEGQVPEEYSFKGAATALTFQKRTDDDSLIRGEVWKDEVLLESYETTIPWGWVWAMTSPLVD